MERSENAKVINATPCSYNGIDFKSKLEMNIYKAIESEGYTPLYEPITFTIWNGFKPRIPFYKKNKSSKKLALENTKIRDITYTPDIIFYAGTRMILVEVKPDYENDVFPYKKKLFRRFLETQFEGISREHMPIYVQVGTIKHLKDFIKILKEEYNNEESERNIPTYN
jgi:hypothetical protein